MLARSLRNSPCFLVLLALTACQATAPADRDDAGTIPGSDGGTRPDSDGGTRPDSDGGGSPTSEYSCCLNRAFYDCPDQAAFDACSGFDIGACLDACAPSDPMCPAECFDMQSSSTHDPSMCMRDAARDGTCGTTSASCDTVVGGASCDYDDDCSSSNCVDGRCYGNGNGNLCDYDDDCTSSNCVEGCCTGNGVGSACDYDDDCDSSNCSDGVCRGNGSGSPCDYDDDCDSSSCTDGTCS